MSKKYKNVIFYILSFIIPSIILGITFYIKKITPFGDYSIVSGDMELQFVPFINEFSEKVKHGDSLMYSWYRGMGYDFIGEIAYYLASPLNVIFLFFKRKNILTGISLLVALKSSLCSLTMFTYLKHHFHTTNDNHIQNDFVMVAFSCCYALCAYILSYYELIMWFDCMIMLPLIILSLEMLINNKKPYLYSLALGFAIFTNFYIGFMLCLFVVLYFFYYILNETDFESIKMLLRITFRFIIHSVTGACMGSVILIPEIITLSTTASTNSSFLYANLLSTNYSLNQTPYHFFMSAFRIFPSGAKLYCGIIMLNLVTLYYFAQNITLRKKISIFSFMLFILLSIYFKLFEYIWNAFHQPNGYIGRNSFLLIFLVIIMSYECFLNIKSISAKSFKYCIILNFIFCAFTIKQYNFHNTIRYILINLFFLFIYETIIFLYTKKTPLLFTIIIFILVIGELAINCIHSIGQSTTITQYKKNINTTLSLLKEQDNLKSQRIKNDFKSHKNMGSLCTYNSIPTYSSTSNNNINKLLSSFGYFSSLNATNDIAWEPVSGSLLGIKYILTEMSDYSSEILKPHTNSSYNTGQYVYENTYCLSIAFAVEENFKDIDIFENNTPFDTINQLSKDVYQCGNIYDIINLDYYDNKLIIPNNTDIYLYCKPLLTDCEFKYDNKITTVYPSKMLGVTIHEDFYKDNYIYHLPPTKNGGQIYYQHDYSSSDIIAYKFNMSNFKKLMEELSKYQIRITSFDDTNIVGTIDTYEPKQVFTSIPYSHGWTVKVDGKKVKTTKCFNTLLSFYIPEGSHKIEFSYITPGLISGCIVSLLSFTVLISISIHRRNEVYIHEYKK